MTKTIWRAAANKNLIRKYVFPPACAKHTLCHVVELPRCHLLVTAGVFEGVWDGGRGRGEAGETREGVRTGLNGLRLKVVNAS